MDPASSGPKVTGIRLIVSDEHLQGGQVVQTYKKIPKSLEDILALLCRKPFKFKDVCREKTPPVEVESILQDGMLHMMGHDGPLRKSIVTTQHLVKFLMNIKNTTLPSIEVQLVAKKESHAAPPAGSPTMSAPPPAAPAAAWGAPPEPSGEAAVGDAAPTDGLRGNEARDRIEELEQENFKMLRSVDRMERQMDEVMRRIEGANEYTERVTSKMQNNSRIAREALNSKIQTQFDDQKKIDASLLAKIEGVTKTLDDLSTQNSSDHKNIMKQINALDERTADRFEDMGAELQALKLKDLELQEEDVRQDKELLKHEHELSRIDDIKVNRVEWQQEIEKAELFNKGEISRLDTKIEDAVEERNRMVQNLLKEMADADCAISKCLQENVERLDGRIDNCCKDLESRFKTARDELAKVRTELVTKVDKDIQTLSETMQREFKDTHRDIQSRDKAIHNRVDEISDKTELTFQGLQQRMEEMVRVERARLGTIEREVFEGAAKMRSDFRNELERVRSDYEQDTAQMTEDLADLHTKFDVTKQEINFFQSRLVEQRDWQQRHLTETTTAMKAAQVDSQEGLAAAQKMLHALRDDAVGFREKMAKYISLLQHSSDAQVNAVSSLEAHRSRMRLELDAIINDHKSYTGDMDGWADDVRVKVERLFRAMEPARVEWRIPNAVQRLRSLKKPLAVKSPSCALKGLREAQMEFYPDGTNNSPHGKSILRLFFPPDAVVRFQCWIGILTDGSHEFDGRRNADTLKPLSVDLAFDGWKDQVRDEDGSIIVYLEVIRDHTCDDESLTREVRIESQ
jgi:hypothetical protein